MAKTSIPSAAWPLSELPAQNARVVLATQGIRIWTTECRLEVFDGKMRLASSDATTMENIAHQGRVAFTILGSEPGKFVHGSGMAHIRSLPGLNQTYIELEPYRVSSGVNQTFELKLHGWTLVPDAGSAPDISKLAFWYQAFRAVTLPLSAIPVLVGALAALAQGHFNWLYLILAMVGIIAAHAGANAAADYFDFKNGVDLSRALSSHLGALAQERVEPEMILIAAFACFLVTALIGLVLVQLAGWTLLWFGLAGLLGAFFYTGRPFSYKYRGMGELMLGVLLGPVAVMGSYYLHTRGWDWGVFLISMALGMLVSSVSLANNLRDLPDDKAAGIHTLPMAIGVSATKRLYYTLTLAPYLVAAAAILINSSFWPIALIVISTPQALKTVQAMHSTTGDLNDIREKSLKTPFPLNSIRAHTQFGFWLVIGLFAASLVQIFVKN